MTWNVKGLGRSKKKRVVKRLITERRCDMLFIQESKLKAVNPRLWHFLVGHGSFSMEYVSSVWAVGGLLSLWDEKFFMVENKVVSYRYILLVGMIKSKNSISNFGNIYVPNDDRER